jgi:acyl carrier protein
MRTSLPTVITLLAKSLQLPQERITADTPLADLGADSLTVIELIFDLEEKYGIQVGDERPTLVVVRDIATHVDAYLEQQKAPS